MRRVLSLWFTTWSVDLAKRRHRQDPRAANALAQRSVLLVTITAGRTLVSKCSQHAHERGVREGMPLAEARPLIFPEEPLVESHSPVRDSRQLNRIGLWAMRFSPIVSLDAPDGIFLDIGGSERLFGDELTFLRSIAAATQRLGFGVRLAVAHTVGAAWALSHFGPESLSQLPRGKERQALAALPVEALRITELSAENLRELGVATIDALLRLPRTKLSARFGEELLLRLDQALGHIAEPIERIEWKTPFVVERIFNGLVSNLATLTSTTQQLLTELVGLIRAEGLGATEVQLRIFPADLPACVHTLPLSRPSLDEALLFALALPKLETTNMGFGVERVMLEATVTCPMHERQSACWSTIETRSTDRELSELLDVLSSRLLPDQLLQPFACESHVPEHAFTNTPFASADETHRAREITRVTSSDRPSVLFSQPESLRVEASTFDDSPAAFHLRGQVFRIVSSQGPERIEGPWWERERRPTRDYYRVGTSPQRTFWIYRELGTGRWYLHGEWA